MVWKRLWNGVYNYAMTAVTALILLYAPLLAAAAAIPEQRGTVTDTIELFSPADLNKLDQALNQGAYRMKVLTATGLSREILESMVEEAYASWKLTGDDIIVILSTNPNLIQMFYDNAGLKSAVYAIAKDYDGDGVEEKPGTELMDKHFMPKAKNGGIADGIIALHEAINGLKAPVVSPPPVPTAADKAAQPSGTPVPTGTVSEPGSESSPQPSAVPQISPPAAEPPAREGISSKVWGGLLLALAGAAAVTYAIRRMLLLKRLRRLEAGCAELEQKASSLIGGPALRELEQGFVQGKTKRLLEDAYGALEEVRSLAEQYKLEAAEKNKQRLNEAEAAMPGLERIVDEQQKLLEQFDSAQAEVKIAIEQAAELSGANAASVERLAAATGYSLSSMRERLEAAGRHAAAASEMEAFDIFGAEDEIKQGLDLLRQIEADAASLESERARAAGMPEHIAAIRLEMDRLKEKERLLLAEDDPYGSFGLFDGLLADTDKELQAGRTSAAAELSARIERLLEQALQQLKDTIRLRDDNRDRLAALETEAREYALLDAKLRHEPERLNRFEFKHWSEVPLQISELQKQTEQLLQGISSVKHLIGADIQQYRKAAGELDVLEAGSKEMARGRELILGRYKELQERLQSLEEAFLSQQSRNSGPQAKARSFGGALGALLGNLDYRASMVQSALRGRPVDLDDVSSNVRQYEAESSSFAAAVAEYIRQKEQAERRLRELRLELSRRENAYRARIHVGRYASGYQSHTSQADRYIASGRFTDAMMELERADRLMEQMEREHQLAVEEEERRAREERQRQEEREREEQRRRQEEEDRRRSQDNSGSSWGSGSGDSGRDNSGSSW